MIDDAAWLEGINALVEQSGGVCQIYALSASDAGKIYRAALSGNGRCRVLMDALNSFFELLDEEREAGLPPRQCICCATEMPELIDQAMVCLTVPDVTQPNHAVGGLICETCAEVKDHLHDRVLVGLREVWPDARLIEINPEAGHA